MKRSQYFGTSQLPKSQHHASGERNIQLGQINGFRNVLGLQGTSIQASESKLGPNHPAREVLHGKQFLKENRIAVGKFGVRVRVGDETIDAEYKSKASILSESNGNTLGDKNQQTLRQKTAIERSEDASVSQATFEEFETLPPTIQEIKRKILSQESNCAVTHLPLKSSHARTFLQQESSNIGTELTKSNPATRLQSDEASNNDERENDYRLVLEQQTRELQKIEENVRSNLHIVRYDDESAANQSKSSKMVPIPLSLNLPQVKVQNKQLSKQTEMQSQKNLSFQNTIYSGQDINGSLLDIPGSTEDGNLRMTKEAKLTQKALANYKKQKQRYMKKNTIFGDEKIAAIDKATQRRTNLVASLLGNSKEAREIQSKFLKMVEVPQEDFNLNCFKLLTEELRNNVTKPDRDLQNQSRLNPKLTKKMTTIEDFITIQPTTAGSNPEYEESMARQDTLYESSISPSVPNLLALTDDPERQLAIQYTSKRQPNRNIQMLQSNLTSVKIEDQQEDENTFITNMVDSSYLIQQSTEGLPNIHQNKYGHISNQLVVRDEDSERDLSNEKQVAFASEYQMISMQDKGFKNYSVNDYSMVEADSVPTVDTPLISRKLPIKKMAVNASVLEMPQTYTREMLWREQSELSFTAGRRKVIRSTGNKRILGDKNGYNHSTLVSHLGRHSRMLTNIKERVKKFQKSDPRGGRLGQSQEETSKKIQRPSGTKTAGFRKYSVPLKPISFGQENERKHFVQPSNLEVNFRTQKQLQTLNTLADSRLQTIIQQPKTSPSNLVIMKTGESPELKDSVYRTQSQALQYLTQDGGNTSSTENLPTSISQILQPWENENTLLGDKNNLSSSSQLLLYQARIKVGENMRMENEKKLSQYKNKRILVNNVQLSQLIRKDMNMFIGKDKKIRKKRKNSSNQRKNITVPSPTQLIRSTLLDESSSDNLSNENINDLVQKPLGMETPETLGSDHNNLNPKLAGLATLPGSLIYKSSLEQFRLSESSNEILVKIQSTASIDGNNASSVARNTLSEFQDRRKRDANNSSLLGSQAYRSSKDQSRDRQDRINKEIHEYYRIVNSDKLESKKQLANVVIRGKNILEPSTSNSYMKHMSAKSEAISHNQGPEQKLNFQQQQRQYEQIDRNEQIPTPDAIRLETLNETTEREATQRQNLNREYSPNKIMVGNTQSRLAELSITQPTRVTQTILKTSAMHSFANDGERLTHSRIANQKKTDHEASLNGTSFSNQQRQQQHADSQNETGFNDPYGTHYHGKFNAIYEEQNREEQSHKIPKGQQQKQRDAQHFQKEPNVSSAKNNYLNQHSFERENGHFAHKINIDNPFFPKVNSKDGSKRTSSVSGIKKSKLRKERERSPDQVNLGQVYNHSNTKGHSEVGSFGTLEERRDSNPVSSKNQTPLPLNHLSLGNLKTHFDFIGTRKLAKPSKYHRQAKSPTQNMDPDGHYRDISPSQTLGQPPVSTKQNSESDRKHVEETFEKVNSKKGKFSLGQTKQTLKHRSVGKSSISLEPSVLPIIKIRMVLAQDHSRKNSQDIIREQKEQQINPQKLDIQVNEDQQDVIGVTVTETEELPIHVSVKQLSQRPSQGSQNLLSQRKTQQQQASKNDESKENFDLMPVIKNDVSTSQRDSKTQR